MEIKVILFLQIAIILFSIWSLVGRRSLKSGSATNELNSHIQYCHKSMWIFLSHYYTLLIIFILCLSLLYSAYQYYNLLISSTNRLSLILSSLISSRSSSSVQYILNYIASASWLWVSYILFSLINPMPTVLVLSPVWENVKISKYLSSR